MCVIKIKVKEIEINIYDAMYQYLYFDIEITYSKFEKILL
jgi:hypothetical protein